MTDLLWKVKEAPMRFFRLLYAFIIADRINGPYVHLKAKDNRVNLFEYRPDLHHVYKKCKISRYNLGDYLGFVITEWMLSKKGLSLDTWVKKRKHLKCVGSNIYAGFQNATIWGSGILQKPQDISRVNALLIHYPLTRLDIRAVRGPLTRDLLLKWGQKCPEVYGDPAILMPLIYQPKYEVKKDVLVIPQFVTEKAFREKYPELNMISMNTDDYKYVIDAIVSCKKLITSSLHAVILADSYGVPSVLFRGLLHRVDFKYLDYYYSTGRRNIHIADSFEEAMQMEPLPLPDLKGLQEGLIKTFPYDLWVENQ